MQVRHVSIFTGDAALPAIVRLPDIASPAPAIVFHNGYAAYKEMYDGMAEALCQHGYLTLQFDPRGTDGESRGRFLCGTQWVEDACAAVSYICGLPEADASRIAFSGVSMGKNQGEAAWQTHLEHMFHDAALCAHGYPSERIDGSYACWGQKVSAAEKEEKRRERPNVAQWLTLSSVLNSYLYYDVRTAASRLHIPLCLVHGTADESINYHCSEELYEVTTAPVKELHLLPGKTHVLPEVACEEVTQLALDWFGRYL